MVPINHGSICKESALAKAWRTLELITSLQKKPIPKQAHQPPRNPKEKKKTTTN